MITIGNIGKFESIPQILNDVLNENISALEEHLLKEWELNQQPRRERRGCCSYKVVAVGFNTFRYDASVGVLNPPHE